MENTIMKAIAAPVLLIIAKLVEMKFIEKEARPIKFLVRDALVVFACAFAPTFAYFQMNETVTELIGGPSVAGAPAQIFTDAPGF